ncbi:MAG: response regulator [Rhodospirillales bacterium]
MHKVVLIVEDNELDMKLIDNLLQVNGYQTIKSIDGSDALSLAREHRPDFIILDIMLPGVSGLEHVKMLKADDELKDIPVIAVTALAMKGDKERILEAGCDAYLSKPITANSFLEMIDRFVK